MPASFHARCSFTIPGRNLFVLSGQILSGVIKEGMLIKLRMNSSVSFELSISTIEMVNTTEGSEVGICVHCSDTDELSILKGLNIGAETIEIDDPVENETMC